MATTPSPVIVFLQRVADGNGVMCTARRAIAFPPGWTLQDVSDGALASVLGGPGELTGYTQIVVPGGIQMPIAGALVAGASAQLAAPALTTAKPFAGVTLSLTGLLALPGAGAAIVGLSGQVGFYLIGGVVYSHSAGLSSLPGGITVSISGNIITLAFPAPSAWAEPVTYAGIVLGGSAPNAALTGSGGVGTSLVTNAGTTYACSLGGTSASGDAPVASGTTGDGLGWLALTGAPTLTYTGTVTVS
jgi:hypothetical protein